MYVLPYHHHVGTSTDMIEVAAGVVNHNGITLRLPVIRAVGIIATNTDFYPDKSQSIEKIVDRVVQQGENGELNNQLPLPEDSSEGPRTRKAGTTLKRGNEGLASPAKKRRIVKGTDFVALDTLQRSTQPPRRCRRDRPQRNWSVY